MSKITIYYIDDQASKEAKRYQRRISSPVLSCSLFAPPAWNEINKLFASAPDIFIIDYDLALAQPNGFIVDYKGSTLAAEIRSRMPETPIVLLTRASVLDSLSLQSKRQLFDHLKIYDELIYKSELDVDISKVQGIIEHLALGFRKLNRYKQKDWKALVQILGADREELELIREATPPISDGAWITTSLTAWIRNVLLAYPGILYNATTSATLLGITADSFLQDEVQALFTSARYEGVYKPDDNRWWKKRLLNIAKSLIIEQQVDGPVNLAFRIAFINKFNVNLLPSLCLWDHTPGADWVCYILKQPVKSQYTLRYYPDTRPSIMDPARVSFRAIRENKDFDEKLVDVDNQKLIKKIWKLDEP